MWTDVSNGFPPRVVTNVAVDSGHSTTAYVAFSGFSGFDDNLGHVFKTTNGGALWTDISGDLPNVPVNSLVPVPDVPNTLFAATDVGVFYTTNGGTNWNSLVNGLPRVAVLGLALQSSTRTLRAATHGRGAWDLNIESIAPAALKFLSVTRTAPNVMHLQGRGVPNESNRLQASTSPSANSFTTLTTVVPDMNGNFAANDNTAGTKKFYRLVYP